MIVPSRGLVLVCLILLSIVLFYDHYYLSVEMSSPSSYEAHGPIKLLYVFIAASDNLARMKITKNNIEYIAQSSGDSDAFSVDCILFSYVPYHKEPDWVHEIELDETHMCTIVRLVGTKYVYFLKNLVPSLLRAANYQYLSIILDDVTLTRPGESAFHFETYHHQIVNHRLNMASPAILGSVHTIFHPTEGGIGRLVSGIEIQATTFDLSAWQCLYELVDTEYPSGTGIDFWFWDYCAESRRIKNPRFAILDSFFVTHNPDHLPSSNGQPRKLRIAQEDAWIAERGIDLRLKRTDVPWPGFRVLGHLED